MRHRRRGNPARGQRGFSIVEMLLTAFILAVGIMGLTMLQAMALKGARGGRSLGTAVQVGEMVMDQIELEGRLSWLNITATQVAAPAPLASLKYINKVPLAPSQTFTIKGEVPVAGAPDPTDTTPFYTVVIAQKDVSAAGTGIISDFTVNVNFSDQVNPVTGLPLQRTVAITRRILHG